MDEPLPLPRLISNAMHAALADTPVVCLLGPRQVGKTTLAQMLAPALAYVTLDDPDVCLNARTDPKGFVANLPERVIVDEVQRAPGLLPVIKMVVDRNRKPGRFLLTGSANLLLLPKATESLAGRMEVILLHPLSEAEKERQGGTFLADLLAGRLSPKTASGAELSIGRQVIDKVVAGGYPEPLLRTPARARQWYRQYLKSIIERDVRDISNIHNADNLARMLEILALRTGTLLNLTSLGNDLKLNRATVANHLAVLERLFLVRQLPAWHKNEANRLIKTPKIHVMDSGLASALAGVSAADWPAQPDRFGHLLESFVVQQLICQAGWTDPELRFWHYRDKDQVEVDLVITRGRQVWGVEVKSSSSAHPDDGHGLRRLADLAGKDYQGGVVLYAGVHALPLAASKGLVMPLNVLWQ